mgnify:FL=1
MNNIWEDFYRKNGDNGMMMFPFPIIIELLKFYENKYNITDRSKLNVLEIGTGSGVNLKYAASLGYNVYGIDISKTAIDYAINSFDKSNLKGNFLVASVDSIPFENDFFHIIIDHGALVCVGENTYIKAIDEINRVAKKGSISLLTPYGENNMSTMVLKYIPENINNASFKGANIFLNSINLNQCIKILNNRFKVVLLRKIERTDYNISENNEYIMGGGEISKVVFNYSLRNYSSFNVAI